MATALIEQKMALEALKTTGWNVSRAAELLGISRRSLQLLMKRHGIKKTGSVAE
ncbi:MAG TPA: helix-turn-helix domain-containing protein [bacterium]|nr:helix-turn-helix domain-containing protein [bacterium]